MRSVAQPPIFIALAALWAAAACGLDAPPPRIVPLSCGNGKLDPGEDCDGAAFRAQRCHGGGRLVCTDRCLLAPGACATYCGDGVVNGDEECDGTDFRDGCHDGTVSCRADCTVDHRACRAWCGDGKVQAPYERCEAGVPLPANVCHQGRLACDRYCQLDLSACWTYCGDGAVNGNEQCDGADFRDGRPCAAATCRSDCTVERSRCP